MNIKEYEKFKIDYNLRESDIAKILGCTLPTLYNKKSNGTFTINDINKIARRFDLSDEYLLNIFFK